MWSGQPQREEGLGPEPGADLIRVGGLAPLRAFVSAGSDPALGDVWDTPMLSELAGVIGELEPADIVRLRRGVLSEVDPVSWKAAERWAAAHLTRGRQTVSLELLRDPDGRSAIRGHDGRVWELTPGLPESLTVDWWRRDWSPDRAAPGSRLKPPGSAARIELDTATVRRVFRANFPRLMRRVTAETWHVRLPKGHDRAAPAGVVAWISPTPDGRFPPVYEPILDELGLIAIGADAAGNERPVTDRLQLVLDGIETVRRGWLIDRDRVYLSGFSGGGRCASLLQLGLPDDFRGCVPVAGIDSYHDAPTGHSAGVWPAGMGKPLAPGLRTLRDRRIAAPVGELDFNHAEAASRVKLLAADGIPARLDTVPGHAHALPAAPVFSQALRWVDEPSREARRNATDRAAKLLADIGPGAGNRAALIEVVRAAPWSGPAWVAAERLGYSRERFLSGAP